MKNIKKLLSLLLCGIMLFGMFPASLFETVEARATVPEPYPKRSFPKSHGRERSNMNIAMTLRQISIQISADFMRAIKQLISQQQPTPITLPII